MKHKRQKAIAFLMLIMVVSFNFTSYGADFRTVKSITPFDKKVIHFKPDQYGNGINEETDILRLGNGRLILKKIQLPKLKRDIQLKANIILTSNGDPWDKSGSCFIIPAQSNINMLDVAAGSARYPETDSSYTENLQGVIASNGFFPPVEIMRFMTPFGVGFFNTGDSLSTSRKKPIYIDEWAPHAKWEEDISDLYPLLTEEVYIGIFIDTWTKEGYQVTLNLELKESEVKQDKLKNKTILPLVNTVYYEGQSHPDIFARQDLSAPFTIPKKAKNIKLKYIVTGHGGHSGGDEFVPNENIITIDNTKVYSFTPWRTDCASFRRFNPATGVWLAEREVSFISREGRQVKTIEEPIASSDLSRSNWCPGTQVTPVTIPLNQLESGDHILKISIPKAKPMEENKMNHWLVSAYLVWEE